MKSSFVFVACLFPLVVSTSGNAQELTADQIVARHLEARGGASRLASLQTVVYRNGKYREPGYEGSGKAFMAMAKPYYKIVGDPEDSTSDFREGYDGSAWEWYKSPGIVVRTVGAANAAIRHNLDPDGPLSAYRSKGTTIERVADETIDGRAAYGLKVTLRDGFQNLIFLDKSSFLVVAVRQSSQFHAFGDVVTTESRVGDYRSVGGVLFPFAYREVVIATNVEQSSMTWGTIEVDRKLPDAWFAPPEFARTPLQSFLEKLYYERADTAAIKWSYIAFRAAHPGLDTRTGSEAIGYQMVKMGDNAGAILLLEMNAKDYPQSSSSAFGLGRAYRTAGDMARAVAQFKRAIELDPKNKRALEALSQINRN